MCISSQRRARHCHLKNYCFEAKKRNSLVDASFAFPQFEHFPSWQIRYRRLLLQWLTEVTCSLLSDSDHNLVQNDVCHCIFNMELVSLSR